MDNVVDDQVQRRRLDWPLVAVIVLGVARSVYLAVASQHRFEAFLSLCGERKTLERIQHMLKTGKPLRN